MSGYEVALNMRWVAWKSMRICAQRGDVDGIKRWMTIHNQISSWMRKQWAPVMDDEADL